MSLKDLAPAKKIRAHLTLIALERGHVVAKHVLDIGGSQPVVGLKWHRLTSFSGVPVSPLPQRNSV